MSSLLDIRTKTRDEYIKIDPSGKIWSNSTLDAYINRAYFQVQTDGQHKRPVQYNNYTFSVSGGTGEYPLPSDFIKMNVCLYNNQSLVPTEKTALKKTLNGPFIAGTPWGYYIYGNKIGLYPIPNNGGTLDIEYFKRLPKLSALQDSLLSDEFDDAIALYAAYLAFNSVTKTDKATIMRADYEQVLSTLLASYIYNDTNIGYSYQVAGYTPSDLSTRHL